MSCVQMMALFGLLQHASSTRVVNRTFTNTMQDHEVFVYGIPAAVTKQELISMFERCGNICHIRMAKRKSQVAFIRFTEPQAVRVSVLCWNAFEIRENCRIFVCRSIVNKNLVLCNIPRRLTPCNIYRTVSMYTTGLHSVHSHMPRDNIGANSGLAILRFKTRSWATVAKVSLSGILNTEWKRRVYIEWYTPGLIWNESAIPSAGEAIPNFLPPWELTNFAGAYNGYGANSSLLPHTFHTTGQDILNFPPLWEPIDCTGAYNGYGANSSPLPYAIPNFLPLGDPTDFTGTYNGYGYNSSLWPLAIPNGPDTPNFPLLGGPTDFAGTHGANPSLLSGVIRTGGPDFANFPLLRDPTDLNGAYSGNRANSSLLPIGSETGTSSFFSDWSGRRNGRLKSERKTKFLTDPPCPCVKGVEFQSRLH